MELKQLTFFKRTAELEHMTRAAAELNVSEPFLSKKISELEKELGVKLFDKTGRRIVLNDCGRAFYRRVQRLFSELEDAKMELLDISGVQEPKFTLVSNAGLYLPGLLKYLMDYGGGFTVTQFSTPLDLIPKLLKNGEADFALSSPPIASDKDLTTIILRKEPGVIIYPEGHWLQGHERASMEEVMEETFICTAKGYGTREAVDAYFGSIGFKPKILIETGDTSSIFRYVRSGLGIAVVAMSAAVESPEFRDHCCVISSECASGDIALTWRSSQYMGWAVNKYISKTQEYFRRLELLTEELMPMKKTAPPPLKRDG